MTRTTTILGVEYRGRPMMNSTAFRVWQLEQDGQREKAERYLSAMRMMGPVDLQDEMTVIPMEGMQTYPTRERIEEKRLAGGWHRWAA